MVDLLYSTPDNPTPKSSKDFVYSLKASKYSFKETKSIIQGINKDIDTYKKNLIYHEISKIYDKIIDFSKSNGENGSITLNYKEQVLDIIGILLFGETKYNDNIIKKVDFSKNKHIIKLMFLNNIGVLYSVQFMCEILSNFYNFMEGVKDSFDKLHSNGVSNDALSIITNDEIIAISDLINDYLSEIADVRSQASNLVFYIHHNLKDHKEYDHLNKDTLKRYYFNDTYDLKNQVKIFETERMFFGQTNHIMRIYNKIFNFVFGDFICIFYTLNNQFKVLSNIKIDL